MLGFVVFDSSAAILNIQKIENSLMHSIMFWLGLCEIHPVMFVQDSIYHSLSRELLYFFQEL